MKVLRNLFKPMLWLLGKVTPKQADLVVFAQTRGRYSDNARALFEWMAEHSSKQVVWLYTSPQPPAADTRGRRFIPRDSGAGLWCILRARVAVLSHGVNDFDRMRFGLSRARILMLWHAIMVKSAYMTDASMSDRRKRRYRRREARHFDRVIASSEIDRYHTAAYMGVRSDRIMVTGLPRQDQVNRAMRERRGTRTSGAFHVLYAPTYRDTPSAQGQSLFFPFSDWDIEAFAEQCRRYKLRILLRPHPNDWRSGNHAKELVRQCTDVFKLATTAEFPDTAELLPFANAIVTDYSSIYLDVLPFDIPCVFVPFDLPEYRAQRGLAYPYELITPGPKVATVAAMTHALIEAVEGAPAWSEQRRQVSAMFFQHHDSGSCGRVAAVVHQLVDGSV